MKIMLKSFLLVLIAILVFACGDKESEGNGDNGNGEDSVGQDTIHVEVVFSGSGETVLYPCLPGDSIEVICFDGSVEHYPCIEGAVVACQDTVH